MSLQQAHVNVYVRGTKFRVPVLTGQLIPYIKTMMTSGNTEIYINEHNPKIFHHILAIVVNPKYKFPTKYIDCLKFYSIPLPASKNTMTWGNFFRTSLSWIVRITVVISTLGFINDAQYSIQNRYVAMLLVYFLVYSSFSVAKWCGKKIEGKQ